MTIHSNHDALQQALFQAAKVGNINLIRELIIAGANPFITDDADRNAIYYMNRYDPVKTDTLLLELEGVISKFRNRGSDAQ